MRQTGKSDVADIDLQEVAPAAQRCLLPGHARGVLPQSTEYGRVESTAPESPLWGIVLAGGEGKRLRDFIRDHLGIERPKQYCTLFGQDSMLRQTIRRAELLIPPERLLTVVNDAHLTYAQAELYDRRPETVIIQPCNRETAPGILLPLLHIHQQAPDAIVTLLPSDHFVFEGAQFMAAVETAAACVMAYPSHLVLLGIESTSPEVAYGWIGTGPVLGCVRGTALYQVQRFWEKPSHQLALTLYLNRYPWNTMVLVGRVGVLLERFQALVPELIGPFHQLRSVLGTPQEATMLQEIYATLPTVNFSQAILARSAQCLGVLHVQGVYWNDWGDPQRVSADLARFGKSPIRREEYRAIPTD